MLRTAVQTWCNGHKNQNNVLHFVCVENTNISFSSNTSGGRGAPAPLPGLSYQPSVSGRSACDLPRGCATTRGDCWHQDQAAEICILFTKLQSVSGKLRPQEVRLERWFCSGAPRQRGGTVVPTGRPWPRRGPSDGNRFDGPFVKSAVCLMHIRVCKALQDTKQENKI